MRAGEEGEQIPRTLKKVYLFNEHSFSSGIVPTSQAYRIKFFNIAHFHPTCSTEKLALYCMLEVYVSIALLPRQLIA